MFVELLPPPHSCPILFWTYLPEVGKPAAPCICPVLVIPEWVCRSPYMSTQLISSALSPFPQTYLLALHVHRSLEATMALGPAFGARTKGRGCWRPPLPFPSLLATSLAWLQACTMHCALGTGEEADSLLSGQTLSQRQMLNLCPESKAEGSLKPKPSSLSAQARLPFSSCSGMRNGN